jgi:hypothetical protein
MASIATDFCVICRYAFNYECGVTQLTFNCYPGIAPSYTFESIKKWHYKYTRIVYHTCNNNYLMFCQFYYEYISFDRYCIQNMPVSWLDEELGVCQWVILILTPMTALIIFCVHLNKGQTAEALENPLYWDILQWYYILLLQFTVGNQSWRMEI